MTEPEPNLTRANRKKRRKWSNNLLNILIAIVVVLIVAISATIIGGGKDKATDKGIPSEKEIVATDKADATKEDEDENLDEVSNTEKKSDEPADTEDEETDEAEDKKSGVVTYESPDDKLIAKTIIDPAWEPIATQQTGKHVSLYDGKSADWNEKEQALAYATELDQNAMIIWKIKNGGSPSQSIGIVSSKDRAEKYRVYLEWVDDKGWQPVKMDVLTTLNFDY